MTNFTYSFKYYAICWERHWEENSRGLRSEEKYTYNILELPFPNADRQLNFQAYAQFVAYALIWRKYYGKFTQLF